MRKTLFIGLIFSTFSGLAQLSGEVTYTSKINMHRDLPNDERGDRMRSFMPEFIDFKSQLLFTSTETVYKNVQDSTQGVSLDEQDQRKQRMMKRMSSPDDIVYCNVQEGLTVEKKTFMDKVFLIRDTISLNQWKLTGEQKEVSGMNCMKAVHIPKEGDTTKVIVWFTPEIPVSSGPGGFGGLPGLIVFLDLNDGKMQISLNSIVMRDIAAGEIEEPKKGKEMTQAEFEDMRREKMEQMRKQWESQGGGHGRPHP